MPLSQSPLQPAVVLVDGARTPFLRSGGAYADLIAYDLAREAVSGLLARSGLDPAELGAVILGTVVQNPATSNVARDASLAAGVPNTVPAHTVTMACISSSRAVADAALLLHAGQAEVVLAGGVEVLSDVPIGFKKNVRRRFFESRKYKTPLEYRKFLQGLKPSDLLPQAPAIAEFSTGETMGESADKLAAAFGVSREAQDAYALASHRRAAQAWAAGHLASEVLPVAAPPDFTPRTRDDTVRADSSLEKLAALDPAFVRPFGTVTAGNSSPLTDGAAAVLLMRADKAESLGLTPRAVVRDFVFVAQDPGEELLLGPAYAVPKLLDRAGLTYADLDVIEIHEAFAGQVLAVLEALSSDRFAREKLGRSGRVADPDMAKINAWGGSL
jgi:acetyl-CoA acetyltransferase family protein